MEQPAQQSVLITGGAGFIGSHAAQTIKEAGHRICILQTFKGGHWKNLKDKGLEDIQLQICQPNQVVEVATAIMHDMKTSVVLHLGANSDTTESDQAKLLMENHQFTSDLCSASFLMGADMIFASSASIYGSPKDNKPFSDCMPSMMRRHGFGGPINGYAYSKLISEIEIDRTQRAVGAGKYVNLRFFNVCGPDEESKGSRASILHKWFRQALTNKDIVAFRDSERTFRDFIHVDDVVSLLLFLVEHNIPCGNYNVGTGHALNLKAALDFIRKKRDDAIIINWIDNPIESSYQYYTCADTSKLRKIVGSVFSPTSGDHLLEKLWDEMEQRYG